MRFGYTLAFIVLLCAAGCSLRSKSHARPTFVHTVESSEGQFGEPFGIVERDGIVYVSDGEKGVIWRFAGDNKPELFASGFETPSAIAFDAKGNLIVADSGANTVCSIDPKGSITLVAGAKGRSGSTDGPAEQALFNAPIGVAVDINGQIYVADTYNDRIRVIENGQVRTLAGAETGFADGTRAKFDTPTGLAVWNDKLLVADSGNRRIRVVEPNGAVWTLAGNGEQDIVNGSPLSASFVQPNAIAIDAVGSIYIADGNAIRIISGVIATVRTLNNGGRGLADDRFPQARFNRPSGLAFESSGNLLVADSDNRYVRRVDSDPIPKTYIRKTRAVIFPSAEQFRNAAPGRWPYDPASAKRDIAGTLGELRGDIRPDDDDIHFHNGLDIAGSYGETARFVRTEKVLLPIAAENFNTLRELIRLPSMGYIHVRLGRRSDGTTFGDPRFQFEQDANGKISGVRVPRGSRFTAGEPIGTLNQFNHVHLIAGPSGGEMNALDALILPGLTDTRPPTIEKVTLFDTNWHHVETKDKTARITLTDQIRIVVRAYDQVDGNSERRRLGVYKVGYQVVREDGTPTAEVKWNIIFDRLPRQGAVKFVYGNGSHSGATGETIFNYIATNPVEGDNYGESFFQPSTLENGSYILRICVADYFGNMTTKDIAFEVKK